jgi:hypothetical protein
LAVRRCTSPPSASSASGSSALGSAWAIDPHTVPRLEGSALDDALNAYAWELDARDDVHASARYRRDLVRMIGRDLIREVLQ